jgi:hypothetical protein
MIRNISWAAAAFLIALVGITQRVGLAQSTPTQPFVGVWRLAEIDDAGPKAKKNVSPQPGVVIFVPRYYSVNVITSDAARAELPRGELNKLPAKQIIDAFGPFAAEAGTYEVKGNEITYKRITAQNPNAMRAGNYSVDTFRFEGKDTLWLTGKSNQDGPESNPQTVKLMRMQ